MDINRDLLTWEDMTTLELRAIYERFGYRRYHMGKFEPYDMYLENRSFLKSETVITFTDPSGKLMALKPDVTMSIVKNTQSDVPSQKLYYIENVFRMAPSGREYREISQMGLEYIGAQGAYAEAETLLLAIQSLEAISPNYVLNVSHMGFMSALFSYCGFDRETAAEIQSSLSQKNTPALMSLASRQGLSDDKLALFRTAVSISAPVLEAVNTLRSYPLTPDMDSALEDIRQAAEALAVAGHADKVFFDLALINDMDYYNGIVFQGYIKGLPRAVLSGGRYDNLMRRFGKSQPALGFALYLGELSRAFSSGRDTDVDILLLYGDSSGTEVMKAVQCLSADGKCVLSEREDPGTVRYKRLLRLEGSKLTEVV